MFGRSLANGFGGLLRFSGRDRPGLFWPYAGVLLGGSMLAWMVVFAAAIVGMSGRIERIAAEHPEDVIISQGPGHYSVEVRGSHPELLPDFTFLLQAMTLIVLVLALLLAAAVTRRLHDSNVRGWVALVPLTLLLVGLHLMSGLFAAVTASGATEPDFSEFIRIFAVNLAYLASLGALIYLLVRRGTPGENRYGPEAIGP